MNHTSLTRSVLLGLLLALLLALPGRTQAGGWAVITLDSLPSTIHAGESFRIGFTVRQHGKTLLSGLSPVISFTRAESARRSPGLAMVDLAKPGHGDSLQFAAEAGNGPGHYIATITLPTEGTWNWEINAFNMPTPMSPLQVSAPIAAGMNLAEGAPQAQDAGFYRWLLLGIAILTLGSLSFLALRRRTAVQS